VSFPLPDFTHFIANPAKILEVTGQEAHPDILSFFPLGDRLVIMRDKPVRMFKDTIYLPDNKVQRPNAGWVISVGPDIGIPGYALLSKVVFGAYAGQILMVGEEQEDFFDSSYLLIDWGSVWGFQSIYTGDPTHA
jgi:co-chaperonin GroES (HSP10)